MTRGAVLWLFMEQASPLVWGIREGNRWLTALEVTVRIPMATVGGQAPFTGYLRGFGQVRLEANGRRAILEPHTQQPRPDVGTAFSLS